MIPPDAYYKVKPKSNAEKASVDQDAKFEVVMGKQKDFNQSTGINGLIAGGAPLIAFFVQALNFNLILQ